MQQRRIIVSGTITLLSVVGDSDVRVNDTEVGRGTPLTSPFIEGIYGTRQKRAHSHPSRRRLVDLDSRLELGRASVVRAVVGAGPGDEDIQKARELFEARGAVVPVHDDRRHRPSPLSR